MTDYPLYEDHLDEDMEQLNPYEDEIEYQDTQEAEVNACSALPTNSVVKINRVNITESPILMCTAAINQTIYLLLDTGATSSIMTKKMADLLNIPIVTA